MKSCLIFMNFRIMILRKINFDIIWWSLMLQLLYICQYSSDIWFFKLCFYECCYSCFECLNRYSMHISVNVLTSWNSHYFFIWCVLQYWKYLIVRPNNIYFLIYLVSFGWTYVTRDLLCYGCWGNYYFLLFLYVFLYFVSITICCTTLCDFLRFITCVFFYY